MRPQLTERLSAEALAKAESDVSCMAEFDPTPRYIEDILWSNWVWGSIRTFMEE